MLSIRYKSTDKCQNDISGIETSSVILSQTKWLQKWKVILQKCHHKVKTKGVVLYTPKIIISIKFIIRATRQFSAKFPKITLGYIWSINL